MTMKTKTPMMSKRSFIIISAAAAALTLAALLMINILSGTPTSFLILTMMGATAYFALARLGDYDPVIPCDHIQSGEAAVGSFALFAATVFFSAAPALPAAVFSGLLVYQLFLRAVISTDERELAITGALALGIIAAATWFMITGGAPVAARMPEAILLGHHAVWPAPWPLAAAALAIVVLALCLPWPLRPELGAWAQGPSFHGGSAGSRAGIAAGLAATRGLLATIALLYSGWTCGIGIGMRKLMRDTRAAPLEFLFLLIFQQAVIMTARMAGVWYAACCILIFSYALFLLNIKRRTHRYDRHQKP